MKLQPIYLYWQDDSFSGLWPFCEVEKITIERIALSSFCTYPDPDIIIIIIIIIIIGN